MRISVRNGSKFKSWSKQDFHMNEIPTRQRTNLLEASLSIIMLSLLFASCVFDAVRLSLSLRSSLFDTVEETDFFS